MHSAEQHWFPRDFKWPDSAFPKWCEGEENGSFSYTTTTQLVVI